MGSRIWPLRAASWGLRQLRPRARACPHGPDRAAGLCRLPAAKVPVRPGRGGSMNRWLGLITASLIALVPETASPQSAPAKQEEALMSQEVKTELAPTGALRAGINLSNFLLDTGKTEAGDPVGVAPDMGSEIARRLGVPVR